MLIASIIVSVSNNLVNTDSYFITKTQYSNYAGNLILFNFFSSMLLLYERGVQSYVLDRWFMKKPRCPPEHGSTPKPVAEQLYPALELLAAIGMVLVKAPLHNTIVVFSSIL